MTTVRVRITLGTVTLSPSEAKALRVGSVIELDEPADAVVRVWAMSDRGMDGQWVGQGQAVSVAGPDGSPRLAVAMRSAKVVMLLAVLLAAMSSAWADDVPSTQPAQQAQVTTQPAAAGIEGQKLRESGGNSGSQSNSPAGFDWVDLLKTLAALAVVAGVIFVTRWVLRRLNRRLAAGVGGGSESFRVLATMPLGGRGDLVLVKLGGRLVLVGASPQGMVALSEIADGAEVAIIEESLSRPPGRGRKEIPHSE